MTDQSVDIVLTGFGSFSVVKENPTAALVSEIIRRDSDSPSFLGWNHVIIRSKIIEVSVPKVEEFFKDLDLRPQRKTLLIHLGIDVNATHFKLESTAWNNMTFRIPDQSGYQPENVEIVDSYPFDSTLQTELLLENVCDNLKKCDFQVEVSRDPGRFLCNYIYYKSLLLNACRKATVQQAVKKEEEVLDGENGSDALFSNNVFSVFIHVPPFEIIEEDKQIAFIRRVIEELLLLVASGNESEHELVS